MGEEILRVENLKKYFPLEKSFVEKILSRQRRYVRAVDGISFSIRRGEIFTLAGETGSGKTTVGRLILRLIDPTDGKIFFDDKDITNLKGEALRELRRKMQPIFQDPYSSLNPRMKVGEAIKHPVEIHGIAGGEEARSLVLEILEKVGLTPPEKFYELYPKDLSGGQRQRVAIARAMIIKPEFIVADEAVSMIDVSLKAAILELMLSFRKELDLTYLFITHELAVAKYISDRIGVMYLGKIVEIAPTSKIFENPIHPYTKALIAAIPVPNPRRKKKFILKGEVPVAPIDIPSGCRFHPRCPLATDKCRRNEPELEEIENNHYIACWLSEEN